MNRQLRYASVLLDWASRKERIYWQRATLNDVARALGRMKRI